MSRSIGSLGFLRPVTAATLLGSVCFAARADVKAGSKLLVASGGNDVVSRYRADSGAPAGDHGDFQLTKRLVPFDTVFPVSMLPALPLAMAYVPAGRGEASPADADQCEPQWVAGVGEPGMDGVIHSLAVFDDGVGDGPALYAGGQFDFAGGVRANALAKWNGSAWSPLGDGIVGNVVRAIATFDDGLGGGPALYVAGSFSSAGGADANNIAKWDGNRWTPLGRGVDALVYSLAVFDDGSGNGAALYVGGAFGMAGGMSSPGIARWDGTSWTSVGGGLNGPVRALVVFDDGLSGPALYAGGGFFYPSGVPGKYIAKWDGRSWTSVGGGMDSTVYSFAVSNGGAEGVALYAGGAFQHAGGVLANYIARWNGFSWSALGSGMVPPLFVAPAVNALTFFDDGTGDGPALYAGGQFISAGGVPASRIARWSNGTWSPLDGGVDGDLFTVPYVSALAVFDEGSSAGAALFAGGEFVSAGGISSNHIGQWGACHCEPVDGDLNCDQVVDGADVGLLLSSWGSCVGCHADLNDDGVVDGSDLGILLADWGVRDK